MFRSNWKTKKLFVFRSTRLLIYTHIKAIILLWPLVCILLNKIKAFLSPICRLKISKLFLDKRKCRHVCCLRKPEDSKKHLFYTVLQKKRVFSASLCSWLWMEFAWICFPTLESLVFLKKHHFPEKILVYRWWEGRGYKQWAE